MSKYDLKKGLSSETLYNVGSKVRERRKKLCISQKDFADLVEMHPANYCRFERGYSNISLLKYLEIIDMLKFLERRYEIMKHRKKDRKLVYIRVSRGGTRL